MTLEMKHALQDSVQASKSALLKSVVVVARICDFQVVSAA
jgi:hypothetical protein